MLQSMQLEWVYLDYLPLLECDEICTQQVAAGDLAKAQRENVGMRI
jgi:hypothetical protein